MLSFFKRKGEEEKLFRQQIFQQMQRLTQEGEKNRELILELEREIKQNGTNISRHNMALEDCLDMLEEAKDTREAENSQLKEKEKEIEKLLEIINTYQQNLWNMRQYAGKNDSLWYEQLLLVEKSLEKGRSLGGIFVVEEPGEKLDYERHEVIERVNTKNAEWDKTVARVDQPGYLYKGKVHKKAKVAVYHFERESS